MKKLVQGVGINDATYATCPAVNGVRVTCQFYSIWSAMLRRAYSKNYKNRNPTYEGVTVCEEWHRFSVFKAWMETQDWEGKQLDKDLLVPGNKIYSPDTCIFVSSQVNCFLNKQTSSRGEFPIGVYFNKKNKKFLAQCRILGYRARQEYLGLFDCPKEAHKAWLDRKRELAVELAALQSDGRVASAILNTKYEDW